MARKRCDWELYPELFTEAIADYKAWMSMAKVAIKYRKAPRVLRKAFLWAWLEIRQTRSVITDKKQYAKDILTWYTDEEMCRKYSISMKTHRKHASEFPFWKSPQTRRLENTLKRERKKEKDTLARTWKKVFWTDFDHLKRFQRDCLTEWVIIIKENLGKIKNTKTVFTNYPVLEVFDITLDWEQRTYHKFWIDNIMLTKAFTGELTIEYATHSDATPLPKIT